MKSVLISYSKYIIPFSLFIGSFFIYSYNLEGQPWHGDEITYLGWAGNYVQLLKQGDLSNPCLKSLDNCNLLYHLPAFGLTYSHLRNLLIGFPMVAENKDGGNFYNWSCYWDCYNPSKGPTVAEMTAGRLLSPLFGSLTIVISYMIGKILFNRHVGIMFSLLFLFYDLWIWYSRTIMTEVHYIFFSMLSFLLLLYAVKTEHLKIKYLIASAVSFGLALSTKILAVEFSALFLGVILYGITARHGTDSTSKRSIPKIMLSALIFFAVSGLSLFLTEPGFYQNPLQEITTMKGDMDNYNRDVWYIGYPTIHGIQPNKILALFHYTVFPSFIEKQMSNPHLNMSGNFGWTYPPTYSSIPLSIFFFVGFGSLIYRVWRSKRWSSEAILLLWFASTFIFTLLIARDFSLERYLLPFLISIIFTASYGLWIFIKNITHNKTKFVFSIYFILVHSMTAMSYWQKIYFSPETTWVNPLHYGTLQDSFDYFLTFVMNIAFVGFLLYMVMIQFKQRMKKRIEIK
jgi:4-amino-4-deoxy-L-arabinose transferase-like glycosyltransferase